VCKVRFDQGRLLAFAWLLQVVFRRETTRSSDSPNADPTIGARELIRAARQTPHGEEGSLRLHLAHLDLPSTQEDIVTLANFRKQLPSAKACCLIVPQERGYSDLVKGTDAKYAQSFRCHFLLLRGEGLAQLP